MSTSVATYKNVPNGTTVHGPVWDARGEGQPNVLNLQDRTITAEVSFKGGAYFLEASDDGVNWYIRANAQSGQSPLYTTTACVMRYWRVSVGQYGSDTPVDVTIKATFGDNQRAPAGYVEFPDQVICFAVLRCDDLAVFVADPQVDQYYLYGDGGGSDGGIVVPAITAAYATKSHDCYFAWLGSDNPGSFGLFITPGNPAVPTDFGFGTGTITSPELKNVFDRVCFSSTASGMALSIPKSGNFTIAGPVAALMELPLGTSFGAQLVISGQNTLSGNAGALVMAGGSALGNGDGGNVQLLGGQADVAGHAPGNVILQAGSNTADATIGQVLAVNLPVADPHVANALWNNVGVLTISAG